MLQRHDRVLEELDLHLREAAQLEVGDGVAEVLEVHRLVVVVLGREDDGGDREEVQPFFGEHEDELGAVVCA